MKTGTDCDYDKQVYWKSMQFWSTRRVILVTIPAPFVSPVVLFLLQTR